MSLTLQTNNTAQGKGRLVSIADLTLIDWIRDYIPPRTSEEQNLLLEDLEDNGQQTPVVVTRIGGDDLVLVDGFGRREHLLELGESQIWVIKHDFRNEAEIKNFMDRRQLGRRNLSDNSRSLVIGRIWNRSKANKNQGGQSDPLTKEELAKDFNTSPASVKRAGKFAKNVEEIVNRIPEAEEFFKEDTTPKAIAQPLAEIALNNPQRAKEIIERVRKEKTDKAKNKVFKEELAYQKEDNIPKKDKLAKPSKLATGTISLSKKLIAKIKIIAKENNLSIDTQVENMLTEYLAEIGVDE